MVELVDRFSNIFRRPNQLRHGERTLGHTHNFHHTTFVVEGGFRVRGELPEGGIVEREVFAGDSIGIRRDVRHEFTAIGKRARVERLAEILAAVDSGEATRARELVMWEIERARQVNRYDCVYAHHTPQGDVVQEYTGWNGAYY